MHIEHVALWTRDLERMRAFYERHFSATANERYRSRRRPFESYFLTLASGARLELMTLDGKRPASIDADAGARCRTTRTRPTMRVAESGPASRWS